MDLKLDCKCLDSSVTMGSNGELPPLIVQVGNEQTAHKMVANSVAQSGAQMIFLALRPGGWAKNIFDPFHHHPLLTSSEFTFEQH